MLNYRNGFRAFLVYGKDSIYRKVEKEAQVLY